MKGSSACLLASIVTASAVSLSSCSTGEHKFVFNRSYSQRSVLCTGSEVTERDSSKEEKFAPRFDGLRFIETLITAHSLVCFSIAVIDVEVAEILKEKSDIFDHHLNLPRRLP